MGAALEITPTIHPEKIENAVPNAFLSVKRVDDDLAAGHLSIQSRKPIGGP